MEYSLIYLLIGVILTGFYHIGATSAKIPVIPSLMDYVMVTLFWPIPVIIAIYTIIRDAMSIN